MGLYWHIVQVRGEVEGRNLVLILTTTVNSKVYGQILKSAYLKKTVVLRVTVSYGGHYRRILLCS